MPNSPRLYCSSQPRPGRKEGQQKTPPVKSQIQLNIPQRVNEQGHWHSIMEHTILTLLLQEASVCKRLPLRLESEIRQDRSSGKSPCLEFGRCPKMVNANQSCKPTNQALDTDNPRTTEKYGELIMILRDLSLARIQKQPYPVNSGQFHRARVETAIVQQVQDHAKGNGTPGPKHCDFALELSFVGCACVGSNRTFHFIFCNLSVFPLLVYRPGPFV